MENDNPVPRQGETDRKEDTEEMNTVKMTMSFIFGIVLGVHGFWLLIYRLGPSVNFASSETLSVDLLNEYVGRIKSLEMVPGFTDTYLACLETQLRFVEVLSNFLDERMELINTLSHIGLVVALMLLTCAIFLAVLMFYYAYLKRRVKKIE